VTTRSWRSARASLSTAALLTVLSAAGGLLPGCGEDDPDVEQDAGAVTGQKDSGTTSPSGSDLAMEFAVSCTDTVNMLCAEFLGEKADADKIKAAAAMSCDQGGETLKSERCPSAKLVGTCLTRGNVGGAKRWYKKFFYEPKTAAEAKSICMGGTFEAAK
jgi:hypothetical protein